ncbi:MAG: hypothetical protein ACYCXW_13325 [Solirubrobacteraceae bacterium]
MTGPDGDPTPPRRTPPLRSLRHDLWPPPLRPGRQVRGSRTELRPPPLRSPRQELADSTAHGDVYLRRLRRAQLQLSLLALVAFGAVFGVMPLALYLLPELHRTHVLGVPLAIWILIVPMPPVFLAIGWLYARRADALDAAFRELVEK